MQNLTNQIAIPEPDWYKKHCEDSWDDTPWEQSEQYKQALADHIASTPEPVEEVAKESVPSDDNYEDTPEEEIPSTPAISVDDGDVMVEIPMHRIRHLVERDEVVTVKVHGKPILINKATLCEMAGGVPFERINLHSVRESLEENISLPEVEELRKAQTRSVSLGTEYHLDEGIPILDTNQFKVKTPSLATKLKVEIADQDFDLEGFALLNGVKPEFKDVAKGLERVVKTPVAAHILNLIQEQDPKQEMAFYAMLFDRLDSDANTFSLALGMMRHLMQYALNVDSLQLRSILTEEFVNKGGASDE